MPRRQRPRVAHALKYAPPEAAKDSSLAARTTRRNATRALLASACILAAGACPGSNDADDPPAGPAAAGNTSAGAPPDASASPQGGGGAGDPLCDAYRRRFSGESPSASTEESECFRSTSEFADGNDNATDCWLYERRPCKEPECAVEPFDELLACARNELVPPTCTACASNTSIASYVQRACRSHARVSVAWCRMYRDIELPCVPKDLNEINEVCRP
jgi:hypothetical protein